MHTLKPRHNLVVSFLKDFSLQNMRHMATFPEMPTIPIFAESYRYFQG